MRVPFRLIDARSVTSLRLTPSGHFENGDGGLVLQSAGSGRKGGVDMAMLTEGSALQLWKIERSGCIMLLKFGLLLTIKGGKMNEKAQLWLNKRKKGSDAQKWRLRAADFIGDPDEPIGGRRRQRRRSSSRTS